MTDTTKTDDTENSTETLTNRSEIVFFLDAKNCNPNGNPLDEEDRPRRDPYTQQGIITDVRLKRYIRDQFDADGHSVYIMSRTQEDGSTATRPWLVKHVVDTNDPDTVNENIVNNFLDNAIDARLFGATLSFSSDNDKFEKQLAKHMPSSITGPVQFTPGRSLHPVQYNEGFESLTSVVATQDGKDTGGFQLNDHRIQYGIYGFSGVVDPNRADKANLTETDVQLLDKTVWKSVRNQTTTRSKVGQSPQLYARIEYTDDTTYIGQMDETIDLDTDAMETPVEEARNTSDIVLNVDDFLARLDKYDDRIDTVHVATGDLYAITYDGDKFPPHELETLIESRGINVNHIDTR